MSQKIVELRKKALAAANEKVINKLNKERIEIVVEPLFFLEDIECPGSVQL